MSRPTFAITLLLLALFAAASGKILRPANPCGLPASNKKCAPKLVCGATGFFWRKATCVRPPRPNPECSCIIDEKPVCCRTIVGKAVVTTTETNACFCGCLSGKVLFNSVCRAPPNPSICILLFDPVCCYIPKFDLTYTAGNSCFCGRAGGRITRKKFCHIK